MIRTERKIFRTRDGVSGSSSSLLLDRLFVLSCRAETVGVEEVKIEFGAGALRLVVNGVRVEEVMRL